MKPETRLELKRFWTDHLSQWKETSLSQALYCKKHGLVVHRFGYWKRKLNNLPLKRSGFIQLPAVSIHPISNISTLTVQLPNKLQIKGISSNNLELNKQLAELLQ